VLLWRLKLEGARRTIIIWLLLVRLVVVFQHVFRLWVMMGVITISNGGDVDADSERGDEGVITISLQPTPSFAHP
jgi:hypothetical protein